MKKKALFYAVATSAVFGAFAEQDIKTNLKLEVLSQDVWRGIIRDEKPVVQGTATVSHSSGLFAAVWANYALDSDSDFTGSSELNNMKYTLGYASELGNLAYSLGTIIYTKPNNSDNDSTYELFVNTSIKNLPVKPYLEVAYDINDLNGLYAKAGIEDQIAVSESLSLTVGAALGYGDSDWNEFFYKESRDSLVDGVVYTKLNYALSENASIGATLSYSELVDNATNEPKTTDNTVYGGVSYSHNF